MRNILGSNRARLLGILLVGTALILACPLLSYAGELLLGNLAPGGTDATKLVTACTDDDEEPVSFDIGSISTDIRVTVSDGAFLDSGGASADAFLVRTTQRSGDIPLVISGDSPSLDWDRDSEDIQGSSGHLEADYNNGLIEWDFGQNNPGNSRIIEGSMVSSDDSECGVVVMKLEDENYYLEVWNIDINEDSDTQTRLGVISSDGGTFTDVSMDFGSMVTSGDMYLAIANWGTKAIALDTASSSSDVTYEGTYAPDVNDDPAQFLRLESGDLSPATAVLLKIKTNAANDGCITIPAEGGSCIRLHTGTAGQVMVTSNDRGTYKIGITDNITSADVAGVSADIVGTSGTREFSITTSDSGGMVRFEVSKDISGVGSADAALPMVIETDFRMESEDLFSGTDFNRPEEELAELVREKLTFVKTWDDGTTASISLENPAAKVFVTKTQTGNTYSVDVRIQLRVLIINGGSAGETESVTVRSLPYLAIYDGTADGSLHDPITLEEASSGGDGSGGGCSLGAVTPAALLLMLPLLAIMRK